MKLEEQKPYSERIQTIVTLFKTSHNFQEATYFLLKLL